MGVGIVDAGSIKPCPHTVRIEKIVGIVDVVSTLQKNGAAVNITDLFCSGLNVRLVPDGHAGQNLCLWDIGGGHGGKGEQTAFQCVHRLLRNQPVAASSHHHRVHYNIFRPIEPQPFCNYFNQPAGSHHADFHRIGRNILEYRVDLRSQKRRRQFYNLPHAGGVLSHQRRDGAHGKNAIHGHCLQVGLNPSASAGVSSSD